MTSYIKKFGAFASFVTLIVAIAIATVSVASAALTISATDITTDGVFTITSVAGTAATLFAANTTGAITIGGTAQTGAFTLGASTGAMTLNLGTGTGTTTVNVASGATNPNTVNVGTGAIANTVTIGSATGASSLDLLFGTGDFTIDGAVDGAITIGDAAQTGTISVGASTADMELNLGTGTGVHTINIGTGGTGADVITIGGNVGTVAIDSGDWDISTTGAMTGIGAITLDGAISGGTSGTFSTFVSADAYRVTNGTTITATGTSTKAQLQAASYFLVDTTGSTAVEVTLGDAGESFDAGDIGRTITFGHGANTGALTVVANDTLTVATVAAAGAAVDLAGDFIDCRVITATLVTCASYAQ